MSPDARSDVLAELKAADEALRAAEALLGLLLLRDASSRVYYAAFHAARALLYSAGVQPRSHEALRSLFARHFVKEGRLAPKYSKLLGSLESARLEGDYDTEFVLGVAEIQPDIDRTREFLTEVREVLKQSGFGPDATG